MTNQETAKINNRQEEISKLNDEQLLNGLEQLVKSERKIMHLILAYVHEIEIRKLHLAKGYDSIYKFLTGHHGYSEDAAYARMQAARLLAKVPEVSEKLKDGVLNLTQLCQVSTAIRAEKKTGNIVTKAETKAILCNIENKNINETRQLIASQLEQPIKVRDSVKPQSNESIRIEVTFTKEQYRIFQQAQDLMSHLVFDRSIAGGIQLLSEFFIQKKLGGNSKKPLLEKPVRSDDQDDTSLMKVSDVSKNFEAAASSTRGSRVKRKKRKYISVKIRRRLLAEANHKCTFIGDSGKVCDSTYQLQLDHVVGLADGGDNDISNLRILCGVHNRIRNSNRRETV